MKRSDNGVKYFGGTQLLVASENEAEAEAFLLGLAISFAVLPDEVIDRIKEIIRK